MVFGGEDGNGKWNALIRAARGGDGWKRGGRGVEEEGVSCI